ncbi:hypothetical protein [Clostridium gasigenes]|uniref:Uncharacterized protein n=1 Tax=Clostridium gasigenes TaxID=94869 RepID=A0A1H0UEM9_9CLOT|nr:hypothetical protein [Clostridium gasigenes]MBB6621887.1 hypothetical protein [Clostridium gasigenes]MBU3102801.1 hypothetical protein [Clostridium gasigenes]MBU3106516.1 hypothetical protein [Clostridium gasigenes]MBU3131417.1 hypothetical protein [Clostridium gasigenes]MBU3134918.1 hypothetical protein [Clostridium gasigenes]
MVNINNTKIVICSKCGTENVVDDNNKFILCTQCKSIKKIKDSKIECY